MIPIRLHLHNFLSYGDACEPIDLTSIHVACLCGPNGHGKSALLDAITWSLWGQARSNSAQDLIRLHQPSMFVELEFMLDGQRYRVVRKWTRGKNAQSDLQFQVQAESGDWRALTGQGLRGTQERINQTLRMDYETFINSAFILQGRADEFARKTPGDRKRILGEILSLSVYDQLCEASRAKRAEAVMRVNALEAQIAAMERECGRLPELHAQVERFTAEHATAESNAAQARAKLNQVMVEKTRLDGVRSQRDDLLRRLAGAEAELSTLGGQLAHVQRRIEAARGLVVRAEDIRKRAVEHAELRKEQEDLNSRSVLLRKLEAERARLERLIQDAHHRLSTQMQLARQDASRLHATVQQLPTFQAETADLERQVASLDALQQELEKAQEELPRLAAEIAEAQAEERRLAAEMDRAAERFDLLKSARAVCPICDGELTDEKRKELGWKLREEKEQLKRDQGTAIQRGGDAQRAQRTVQQRIVEFQKKLRTGQVMRDRLVQAKQRLLELDEIQKDLPKHLEHVQVLERQLATNDFAAEERGQLADLEGRIRQQSFDEKRFSEIAKRLQELATADRDLHSLESAEADLPACAAQETELQESLRAREAALAKDRETRAELDIALKRLPEIETELRSLDSALRTAEAAEATLARQLGAATEALRTCEALGPQLAEKKKERESAARDQAAYEELSKAFGRNGIQALIIENSLPELEQEANALLTRMSDGQLHVQLKTQKELKAGGQAETLEIEISDGIGSRRYELFSGGEAFRINFALRIALSKLLARRAGARLETLVIDEGFGSQDQEGRHRLVEAIQTVQDDFARILVITHIDELKDAFATRIEVTKGAGGSQVAVY